MSNLDYILLTFILLITFFSAIKGFLHELISILSLVLAALLSYNTAFFLEAQIEKIIQIKLVSSFLAYSLIFLLSLFIINKVLQFLFAKIEMNKAIDITLGIVFGFIKGFIVVALLSTAVDLIIDEKKPPKFLQESSIRSFIEDIKNNTFH